jgi:hypothetical protein
MVTFDEVLKFDPDQLLEIFRVCKSAQGTCVNLGGTLAGLDSLHTWTGEASDAARNAVGRTRVDIDGHGQEVAQVGAAAQDCHDEAVALKKAANDCEADADSHHLVIDPTSGTVSDPYPPNTTSWTADQKNAYSATITQLQSRVNAVISDAVRFDEDLAALIDGADGRIPLTPPGKPDENEVDRHANQIAAFRNMYHRDPTSTNDWQMAAILDPHSYDPKNKGVEAQIGVVSINPVPGQGIVRASQYIEQRDVWGFPPPSREMGDNRGADANFDPEQTRVATSIDFDNGIVVMRQNPSVQEHSDGSPGDVEVGTPQGQVWQDSDGSVRIQYSAGNPFAPGISEHPPSGTILDGHAETVNGDLVFSPGPNGVAINGTRTDYPSMEVYQNHVDQPTSTILLDPARSGSSLGPATNLPFHHDIGLGAMATRPFHEWNHEYDIPGNDLPSAAFGSPSNPPRVPQPPSDTTLAPA